MRKGYIDHGGICRNDWTYLGFPSLPGGTCAAPYELYHRVERELAAVTSFGSSRTAVRAQRMG